MLTLFEQALVMHIIGDWILQNDWMANNKLSLKHPAAWIHAGIHAVLLGLVLGWPAGLIIGVFHMLIDTRVPFRWWQRTFRMTEDGPTAVHVAIWTDQVMHVLCLAIWVQFFADFTLN
ncbi:MAG: DUF3307 domain-containing protein [Puniceicoccaceae bacterium]